MLIDWFTVGAQVLNFLILVWLLKRYLYRPILTAIDAREKRIADELADADAKKTAARKERDDFQARNKAFDEQRAALLAKATDDATTERDRLIVEAHKSADDLRTKQAAALKSEQAHLGDEIARTASKEVFAIARKALGDLADAGLEKQMTDVFLRRLRELDGGDKRALADAFGTSPASAIVHSTFDLAPADRKAIQDAVGQTFSTAAVLAFDVVPDGLGGIELTVGGRKLSWNIGGYLASMQQELGLVLEPDIAPAGPDTVASNRPSKPTIAAEGVR